MTNIETKHIVAVISWFLFAGLAIKYAPMVLVALLGCGAAIVVYSIFKEIRS